MKIQRGMRERGVLAGDGVEDVPGERGPMVLVRAHHGVERGRGALARTAEALACARRMIRRSEILLSHTITTLARARRALEQARNTLNPEG